MIKTCRIISNNAATTVFDFDGIEVQVPSIGRQAYAVKVKFENGKYEVVPDDYKEKNVKKTTEHKESKKDEDEIIID